MILGVHILHKASHRLLSPVMLQEANAFMISFVLLLDKLCDKATSSQVGGNDFFVFSYLMRGAFSDVLSGVQGDDSTSHIVE